MWAGVTLIAPKANFRINGGKNSAFLREIQRRLWRSGVCTALRMAGAPLAFNLIGSGLLLRPSQIQLRDPIQLAWMVK